MPCSWLATMRPSTRWGLLDMVADQPSCCSTYLFALAVACQAELMSQ